MKKTITRNVMMNTGKIMIGFSLVLLSVAMMVSPSGATGPGDSCEVGSGIILQTAVTADPIALNHGCMTGFVGDKPCNNATYPYER
jgi:hypothetical protein